MGVVHRFWVRHNFNFKRVALTSGIRGSVCEVCGKIEDVFDESEWSGCLKLEVGTIDSEVNSESASLMEGAYRPANVNEHGETLYRIKVNPDACMFYACPVGDRSS